MTRTCCVQEQHSLCRQERHIPHASCWFIFAASSSLPTDHGWAAKASGALLLVTSGEAGLCPAPHSCPGLCPKDRAGPSGPLGSAWEALLDVSQPRAVCANVLQGESPEKTYGMGGTGHLSRGGLLTDPWGSVWLESELRPSL